MLGLGVRIPELATRGRRTPAAVFDFTGGVLPAGAVLTRGSSGRRVAADGSLAAAAGDVARFDYDPASHALRGLLIEGAATNANSWSEEFDNSAGWSAGANTITANAAKAPDGAMTAELAVPTIPAGPHNLLPSATASFIAGTAYTRSIFVKAAGYRYPRLSLPGSYFTAGRFGVFDLTAKTALGETNVTASIEEHAGGWFRIAIGAVATASGSAALSGLGINASYVAASEAFAGDGTSGLYVWGAQFEEGARPSSYVATSSAAATRAADVLTLNWASRGVGDGAITVRYGFDDDSVQDVATTVAGGTASVPVTLNRARIRRAERV